MTEAICPRRVVQVVEKGLRLRIKSIQTRGPDPQIPLPIDEKNLDFLPGNRGGVIRIVPENSKVIAVITVESILGAKPHKSLVILQDGVHQTLGKAVVDGEPLEVISILLRTESGTGRHTKQQTYNHQIQNPYAAQVHANKRLWALLSINSHKLGFLRDRTRNSDIQKSLMITSD